MNKAPDYHLRPHKAVDRNLFCQIIRKLSSVHAITDYRYIGLGSYEFDDFKLMHRQFGLKDMHSIEMNEELFKRQEFNKPYSCISLFKKTCSEYIDEDFDSNINSIVWLDFSSANEKQSQIDDFSNLILKVHEYDIIRITLNARAACLGFEGITNTEEREKQRLIKLKEMLSDYLPSDIKTEDVQTRNYPFLLLRVVRKAIYDNLDPSLMACPISNYLYSDGQQMLTITMLILPISEKEVCLKKLNDCFKDWDGFVKIDSWESINSIELPPLTVHEQLELSQIEDSETCIGEASEKMGIKVEEIKQFLKFIRFYPNYQPVVI